MDSYVILDLFTGVINLAITGICFFVCYIIAKNNNMSTYYTLLGFFGVIGVLAVYLILYLGNNNQNSHNNQGNYNRQNSYGNQENYNGQSSYGNQNNNGDNINSSDYYQQQSEEKFKYCPKCGAKIEKLASFCSYCGKEFNK